MVVRRKWYKNKKLLVATTIFLGLSGYFLYNQSNMKTIRSPDVKQERKTLRKKKPSSDSVVSQAERTLEKPDYVIEGEKKEYALKMMDETISYLESFRGKDSIREVSPSKKNHLFLTDLQMARNLTTMLYVGYNYNRDSFELYGSASENVQQFVFTISRSDKDRLSFAGNFVPATGQFEIVQMKGVPIPVENKDVQFDPALDPKVPTEFLDKLEKEKNEEQNNDK
ncbi:hypothetical protein HZZ02_08130 [Streptococcus danieliae]|nr:hypothetical protein [Streptococcus danieliae]